MTRCFLGWELSAESRAYLHRQIAPLHRRLSDEHGWPVRLVPPDNWHATLLFFPDLSAEERAVVWDLVASGVAAGAWGDLAFRWRGLGLWPSPRRPSLVCVEAEPHLDSVRWPLAARLPEAPFSKGDGGHLLHYIPHITVMRFRKGRGGHLPRPRDWEALQPLMPRIEASAIRFDRVSFFLSTVSPAQPVYPRERTLALGDARGPAMA